MGTVAVLALGQRGGLLHAIWPGLDTNGCELFSVDDRGIDLGLIEQFLGAVYFLRRTMDNEEEFAVLDLCLVLQNAILRHPDAVHGRAEDA